MIDAAAVKQPVSPSEDEAGAPNPVATRLQERHSFHNPNREPKR
jgi:hypothetical protein